MPDATAPCSAHTKQGAAPSAHAAGQVSTLARPVKTRPTSPILPWLTPFWPKPREAVTGRKVPACFGTQ
jgi:hypothetical protein